MNDLHPSTTIISKIHFFPMFHQYLSIYLSIWSFPYLTYSQTGALIGRFGITIFLNFLFSLIFMGAGDKDDSVASNLNSHFGAITMITISTMMGSAQPIVSAFTSI